VVEDDAGRVVVVAEVVGPVEEAGCERVDVGARDVLVDGANDDGDAVVDVDVPGDPVDSGATDVGGRVVVVGADGPAAPVGLDAALGSGRTSR